MQGRVPEGSVAITSVRGPGRTQAERGHGAGSRGRWLTSWDLVTREYAARIPDLPRELSGMRVAHLSDLHLGRMVPASFISRAVEAARRLEPDLVALTGDYVDSGTGFIGEAARVLSGLCRGGVPVAAVLGNHDWYACGSTVRRALEDAGIAVIDNDRVFLDATTRRLEDSPRSRGALCVAGLGDLLEDRIDPARALGGVPERMARLVLAHNPDCAETGAVRNGPRIDLMLAGHTHGGQIRLPLIGTPVTMSRHGSKYAGGLVRGPACPVLVSRGVGMTLMPVRWGVPPEVVCVRLEAA